MQTPIWIIRLLCNIPDKLKSRTKSVTFMGHVVTNEGIKVDPDKAKAIRDMPKPADIESVQRLNGFVNYLRKSA